jgi:2-polyprenyl-3-methyl-5-hydroxy-6-metoxy-1,4-benzoquinol methylase
LPRYADGPLNQPIPDPAESAYSSRILPLFIDYLQQHPGGSLLDLGLVCGDNIRFLASRVGKLYVCDMFQRLSQELRRGRSASHIWRHLNYPVGSFEAVQLWDLVDHVQDRDLARLVDLCILMVKPKGMMMLIAKGERSQGTASHAFVIGEGFQLLMRPQPDLDLPLCYRHNRDLISLLSPFKLVKSYIYRSGLREFLFEHP